MEKKAADALEVAAQAHQAPQKNKEAKSPKVCVRL